MNTIYTQYIYAPPDPIWRRLIKDVPDNLDIDKCWDFPRPIYFNNPYIMINWRKYNARKLSWALYNKTEPPFNIGVTCGNVQCLNPTHLTQVYRGG